MSKTYKSIMGIWGFLEHSSFPVACVPHALSGMLFPSHMIETRVLDYSVGALYGEFHLPFRLTKTPSLLRSFSRRALGRIFVRASAVSSSPAFHMHSIPDKLESKNPLWMGNPSKKNFFCIKKKLSSKIKKKLFSQSKKTFFASKKKLSLPVYRQA